MIRRWGPLPRELLGVGDCSATVRIVTLTVSRPHQGEFAWSVTIAPDVARDEAAAGQIQEVIAGAESGDAVQLWIEQAADHDDAFAADLGFDPYRDLWRMQRPLPAPRATIATRAFVPGADDDEFLAVNNRAFHWHPEQGGLTAADLAERMAEGWFDAEGFRLHERGGRLAGFCWTKVHPDETPPAGEIYAIAVDPDFHGQGLGKPMTLAGLDHLSDRGLTEGFLYVESDNDPAVATYHRLGFDHRSTNRAYRRIVE
ncbi:MAG: mycothiol synthase [Acidimicrobiia bacterium]|nr:mycothiol synthase [Acidimicrobiia bacterium]MYE72534.1 mycothiol synthase [Acidimicrobiia bacterium]MYJ62636.1 mycothiol synthase [Acidimicrobiia bacterium]